MEAGMGHTAHQSLWARDHHTVLSIGHSLRPLHALSSNLHSNSLSFLIYKTGMGTRPTREKGIATNRFGWISALKTNTRKWYFTLVMATAAQSGSYWHDTAMNRKRP